MTRAGPRRALAQARARARGAVRVVLVAGSLHLDPATPRDAHRGVAIPEVSAQ